MDKELEQFKIDLTIAVQETIQKTVNGKIDKIKEHLIRQDSILVEIREDIKEIKDDTDPIVEAKKGVATLGKLIIWLSLVTGAVLTILKLI